MLFILDTHSTMFHTLDVIHIITLPSSISFVCIEDIVKVQVQIGYCRNNFHWFHHLSHWWVGHTQKTDANLLQSIWNPLQSILSAFWIFSFSESTVAQFFSGSGSGHYGCLWMLLFSWVAFLGPDCIFWLHHQG